MPEVRVRWYAVIAGLGAASLVLLPGGASTADRPQSGNDAVVRLAALERLPGDELADWVSFADAVVAASVTGEREKPPSAEEAATGEGLLVRDVTIAIEEVLWVHPTVTHLPSPEFTMTTVGWVFDDGKKSPVAFEGAVRLEVGGLYLMPITFWDRSDEWAPIAPSSVMPLDGDERVRLAHEDDGGAESSTAALAGSSLAEVRATLAATEPYPAAEANRHLDPVERLAAVGPEALAGP